MIRFDKVNRGDGACHALVDGTETVHQREFGPRARQRLADSRTPFAEAA